MPYDQLEATVPRWVTMLAETEVRLGSMAVVTWGAMRMSVNPLELGAIWMPARYLKYHADWLGERKRRRKSEIRENENDEEKKEKKRRKEEKKIRKNHFGCEK